MRTTSSITFAYKPRTRPINPRLLAEWNRLEVAREEDASIGWKLPTRLLVESLDRLDVSGPAPSDAPFGAPTARPESALGERPKSRDRRFAGQVAASDRGRGLIPAPDPQMPQLAVVQSAPSVDYDANGLVRYGRESAELEEDWSDNVTAGKYFYTPVGPDQLLRLNAQNRRQIRVLQRDGTVKEVALGALTGAVSDQIRVLADDLAESGAVLLPDVRHAGNGILEPRDRHGRSQARLK